MQSILVVGAGRGGHRFDLTEGAATTRRVKELAEGASTAFVPQCGPGPRLRPDRSP